MANKATEINEKLNNIVECCICIERFTDPRILPCFHTFCVNCLKEIGLKAKKGPGDKMSCPQCRAEFTVPLCGFMGLTKNFFMDKLLEVIHLSSKQNVCDLNTGSCSSVKWYCKECRLNLCDECSKVHKTIKTQKHHDIVPFVNHTMPLDINHSPFCDQHEKEKLKIFCNDCHVVLCTFCFLENHQSHKWSKVAEAAENFRTQMIENINMLNSCASENRSITEENNTTFFESVSNVESAVKMKKLQVKALLEEIVDEDESSLLMRLASLTRTASKQIEMEIEEIDRHQTKLDGYIRFCNDSFARASDVDFCRAASELDNRAKELKDLLGTVMNRKPTKLRISFEEKKSENFLKTHYGNLLGEIEVCSDQLISGNDSDEKASQTAKPKIKNAIAIIDPNTGQNVLEYLETSSRQTSNEALKIKSEFAHQVTQRISLGDKSANANSEENISEQPLYGARPKYLLATVPAVSLLDKQRHVEEKSIQEKSHEQVQDRAKEKSRETVLEKVEEKIPEKWQQQQAQERRHGRAPGPGTPLNPSGRIMYDREFLLQFQFIPESLKTPLGFPPQFPEIVRGSLPQRDIPSQTNLVPVPCYNSMTRFEPHQPLNKNWMPVKRDSSRKRNKVLNN